jgi:hypothetical protein
MAVPVQYKDVPTDAMGDGYWFEPMTRGDGRRDVNMNTGDNIRIINIICI